MLLSADMSEARVWISRHCNQSRRISQARAFAFNDRPGRLLMACWCPADERLSTIAANAEKAATSHAGKG